MLAGEAGGAAAPPDMLAVGTFGKTFGQSVKIWQTKNPEKFEGNHNFESTQKLFLKCSKEASHMVTPSFS